MEILQQTHGALVDAGNLDRHFLVDLIEADTHDVGDIQAALGDTGDLHAGPGQVVVQAGREFASGQGRVQVAGKGGQQLMPGSQAGRL